LETACCEYCGCLALWVWQWLSRLDYPNPDEPWDFYVWNPVVLLVELDDFFQTPNHRVESPAGGDVMGGKFAGWRKEHHPFPMVQVLSTQSHPHSVFTGYNVA